MRTLLLAVCFVSVGACTSSISSPAMPTESVTSAVETAAIERAYTRWRHAVETADIDEYVAVLHPEVRMMPPGAPAVEGSSSYAGFLEPVFAAADYRIEVVQLPQIEFVGELALVEYEYIIHLALKDATSGVTEPGALTANRTRTRYFDVLRKTDAGNWGVWRHTWRTMPD